MTDSETKDQDKTETGSDDKETGFWDQLKAVVRGEVKAEFEERIKSSKPVGTSRTGRSTIPDFLANLMWPEGK